MEIGTVKADKKLKIYTIKGKRVDREDFQLGAHVGEAVPIEASSENIKKAVDKALVSNGKVCGIYQEKKLVGILGGKSMKIVVWKSPKVLSSLLRRVFGVREEA